MAVPSAPARIALGDKVKDTWLVKKKLGEGSCGVVSDERAAADLILVPQVYLVHSLKHAGPEGRAALKVEPFMKCKDDEILKMEVFVLRKMQQSRHVCRLLMAGKEKNYRHVVDLQRRSLPTCSFMVISLLGRELSELRRRNTDRKMPPVSVLKVGLQTLQAIQDLHTVGFVHSACPRQLSSSARCRGREADELRVRRRQQAPGAHVRLRARAPDPHLAGRQGEAARAARQGLLPRHRPLLQPQRAQLQGAGPPRRPLELAGGRRSALSLIPPRFCSTCSSS